MLCSNNLTRTNPRYMSFTQNEAIWSNMATFVSSYDEMIAAPGYCFLRRVVGLAGFPSVTIIPAPQFSLPAVAEPSV